MEMPFLALAAERLEHAAEHRDVLIAAASLRQVRRLFVATLQALNQRLEALPAQAGARQPVALSRTWMRRGMASASNR
jgi:ribonuclease HIII